MKLSMRYDPVKLGPDPIVYSIPKRQSSYRVDIYVMRAGATVADRRVLRYPDRFRVAEVAENALAEFRAMIPPECFCRRRVLRDLGGMTAHTLAGAG